MHHSSHDISAAILYQCNGLFVAKDMHCCGTSMGRRGDNHEKRPHPGHIVTWKKHANHGQGQILVLEKSSCTLLWCGDAEIVKLCMCEKCPKEQNLK
jgi:hypothetical protein